MRAALEHRRRLGGLVGLVVGLVLLGAAPLVVEANDYQVRVVTATPTATAPATPTPTATPTPSLGPGGAPAGTSAAPADEGADEPTDATDAANQGDTARAGPLGQDVSFTYPVPDDQPANYDLASGHFFSQAVPNAPRGFGFTVADAAGIPLWSEYLRLGGFPRLGYPISRRFIRDDQVTQAFQYGLLGWQGALGQAEIVELAWDETLPDEVVEPEPPARLGAWAAHQPWSGWWWPATSAVRGPHLFDANGPLAKYDRFVERSGRGNPGTLEWERRELWLTGRFGGLTWAGHCNGWAAAALLEAEPAEPREIGGVAFGVADLKGLLASYHFADAATWLHGGEADLSPVDFHGRLLYWLGNDKKGFVLTFRPAGDEEVWSYPAYRFELVTSPDPLEPDVTHVRATVWLADNDVPANFVGLRPWKGDGQTYEYRLLGPPHAPTGGVWEGASAAGRFARPWTIWYPDPETRNLDRVLASPDLEYGTIRQILRR